MEKAEELTIREKIVITICIFMIQVIKPWKHDFQFKEFFEEIKSNFKQSPK